MACIHKRVVNKQVAFYHYTSIHVIDHIQQFKQCILLALNNRTQRTTSFAVLFKTTANETVCTNELWFAVTVQ